VKLPILALALAASACDIKPGPVFDQAEITAIQSMCVRQGGVNVEVYMNSNGVYRSTCKATPKSSTP
jgi:hypothetical protein